MSNFISSISAAGLMEMPPVSKVMPLPTSTSGATDLAAPWYFATMNFSGSFDPCATARKQPMPSFSTSLRPNTCTLRPKSLPSRLACAARYAGVQWLPGRLAHSRASATPAAMASPRVRPSRAAADSDTVHARLTRSSFDAAGAEGLVWRYTYRPSPTAPSNACA